MAALKTAQAKARPFVVQVFAPWCPTCRAQAPTIAALSELPDYDSLVIRHLDFDDRVAKEKALGVWQQSTLILYKGSREVGRTLGSTHPGQIKAFAAKALG